MASINELKKGDLTPAVSYVKIGGMFMVLAALSVSAVIGYLHLSSQSDSSKESNDVPTETGYVPSSYFPTFSDKSLDEKRALEDAKQAENQTQVITLVPQTSDSVSETEQKKEQESERKQFLAKQEQIQLTKEEQEVKAHLQTLKQLQEERRARLLARRGEEPTKWKVVESIPTIESRKNPPPETPSDRDFSSQGIEKDTSTYPVDLSRVVTTDRYIPCILIDNINSQLEGRATCMVERNVYGFHGRNLLIPAGSKFMGKHGTLKKVGDERFNIDWTRLLRPDGAHVKLTDAYTSDRTGATGLEGIVNNRTWEKYGGALLTSTISAIAQMSIASEGNNNTRIAIESYGTDLGRVTSAMLQENINIKPFSIVPAGTRIHVIPTTDIWLKSSDQGQMFAPVEQPRGTTE